MVKEAMNSGVVAIFVPVFVETLTPWSLGL